MQAMNTFASSTIRPLRVGKIGSTIVGTSEKASTTPKIMMRHAGCRPSEINAVLQPILTEALTLAGCEKGNIQLFDLASGCLTIEAQQGFDAAFLSAFRSVNAENGCSCRRAIPL